MLVFGVYSVLEANQLTRVATFHQFFLGDAVYIRSQQTPWGRNVRFFFRLGEDILKGKCPQQHLNSMRSTSDVLFEKVEQNHGCG